MATKSLVLLDIYQGVFNLISNIFKIYDGRRVIIVGKMLYSEIVYRDEMVSSLSDGGAGG